MGKTSGMKIFLIGILATIVTALAGIGGATTYFYFLDDEVSKVINDKFNNKETEDPGEEKTPEEILEEMLVLEERILELEQSEVNKDLTIEQKQAKIDLLTAQLNALQIQYNLLTEYMPQFGVLNSEDLISYSSNDTMFIINSIRYNDSLLYNEINLSPLTTTGFLYETIIVDGIFNMNYLETIYLKSESSINLGMNSISNCPNLKTIILNCSTNISIFKTSIVNCPNLETIYVNSSVYDILISDIYFGEFLTSNNVSLEILV